MPSKHRGTGLAELDVEHMLRPRCGAPCPPELASPDGFGPCMRHARHEALCGSGFVGDDGEIYTVSWYTPE